MPRKKAPKTPARRKRHYRSHSFSEREKVVGLYEQGYGSKLIAKQMKLDDSMVRAWLRKYRAGGLNALLLSCRPIKDRTTLVNRRKEKDRLFGDAMEAFSTSLESVASITRRFQINYATFRYHVWRHHPELLEKRKQLRKLFSRS